MIHIIDRVVDVDSEVFHDAGGWGSLLCKVNDSLINMCVLPSSESESHSSLSVVSLDTSTELLQMILKLSF